MLNLHAATLTFICISCFLMGYSIGNFIGWLQGKKQDKDNPIAVEVQNNIFYGEKENIKEDKEVVMQKINKHCSSPHRPSPLHKVSNYVHRQKKDEE